MDEIKFGHDYIPEWPSLPGTLTELIRKNGKVKAVKIEYYNGGKRWYSIKSFIRNFKHYQNCGKCEKEKRNDIAQGKVHVDAKEHEDRQS